VLFIYFFCDVYSTIINGIYNLCYCEFIEVSFAMHVLICIFLLLAGSSHAVITLDNTNWVDYASNPVYDPEFRAYYPSVIYDDPIYKMWTSDGNGITSLATSADGIIWSHIANCTGLLNSHHVSVLKTANDSYHIWYWDFGVSSVPYNNESIRHANSSNGIDWLNDAPIQQDPNQLLINVSAGPPTPWNRGSYGPCSLLFNDSISTLDTVNIMNNRFVMYYDGTTGGDEAIGVAGSVDGVYWVGNPTNLPVFGLEIGDTVFKTRSSTVVRAGNIYYMWYSYGINSPDDGISFAESTNGIDWEDDPNNPIFSIDESVGWRYNRTYTPSVIMEETGNGTLFKMWYTGKDASNYAIGYAALLDLPTTVPTSTAESSSDVPTTTAAAVLPTLSVGAIIGICFIGVFFLCILVLNLAGSIVPSIFTKPKTARRRFSPHKVNVVYL